MSVFTPVPFSFITSAAAITPVYLLDFYPGALYAYSTRKLNSNYNGFCMTVEGIGGTQNVGFDSNGNLDTGSIISVQGTSPVRVITWYDQSGNGYNVVESNSAIAPYIQNGGVITTITAGKPALYFNTAVNMTGDLGAPTDSYFSAFAIDKVNNTSNTYGIWGQGKTTGTYAGKNIGMLDHDSNALLDFSWGAGQEASYSPNTTNAKSAAMVRRSSGSPANAVYLNGTVGSVTTSVTNVTLDGQINIGATYTDNDTFNYYGYIAEVVVYKTDQTSNVTGIYDNQDTYYNLP
jgi:hypothetical protein